jgi:hypothetical protein
MRVCRSCCAAMTAVTGQISGCAGNLAVAGMDVVLTDPGMVTLWMGTTDSSGHYSGSIAITGTVVVTVTVTPLSARFAITAGTVSVTSGTAATKNITLNPASGYACAGCQYPVAKTITVVDPNWGTFTATWTASLPAPDSGPGWTTGMQSLTYPGYAPGGCAAGTLHISYVMISTTGSFAPSIHGTYWDVSTVAGDCPASTSTHIEIFAWGPGTTTTCPAASTAATFVTSCVVHYVVLTLVFAGTYTLTYQE